MILDLPRFVREGRPVWDELDRWVDRLERQPGQRLTIEEAKRFHYLYQRASGDLARVVTFAAEPAIRGHLESLVGRAYGEIHRQDRGSVRWSPWFWFTQTFPQVFQRRIRAFALACLVMLAGAAFGAFALMIDPEAKAVLLPFGHGEMDPGERVAQEESGDRDGGAHASFSAQLMTHNTRVSIFALALGMTWGCGTLVLLFYNGVILGAIVVDYLAAGQGVFLAGWLLPHGSVEIPAILIAGQAGLLLGGGLIGWGSRENLRVRLRTLGPDLVTLIGGVAVLLVWAGIIESFFSQYHEPVVPYEVKIAFGAAQLLLLAAFLARSRRQREAAGAPAATAPSAV